MKRKNVLIVLSDCFGAYDTCLNKASMSKKNKEACGDCSGYTNIRVGLCNCKFKMSCHTGRQLVTHKYKIQPDKCDTYESFLEFEKEDGVLYHKDIKLDMLRKKYVNFRIIEKRYELESKINDRAKTDNKG